MLRRMNAEVYKALDCIGFRECFRGANNFGSNDHNLNQHDLLLITVKIEKS